MQRSLKVIDKNFIDLELRINRTTLHRELVRNSLKRDNYKANKAHLLSHERKERYGRGRSFIKTQQEQIVNWLRNEPIVTKANIGALS